MISKFVLAAFVAGISSAVLADTCMVSPISGNTVSGRFGKFREGGQANNGSANQSPHMHDGLDFSTNGASEPLYAATDGKITFIGKRGTAGNTILIQRDSGDVVAYYHMSGFAPGLQVGSLVKAGQNVGLSGNTPSAEMAKHLHFVYGTASQDAVRAKSFPAGASQGAFNPGQLPSVFNQQAGLGWKTDPSPYFCQTYPISDGNPQYYPILGKDTKEQYQKLFNASPQQLAFDAQQVIAANADAAIAAAAGKSTVDFLADKDAYGSLPSPPIGGYETMSPSEMMMTEATRRLSDADWNTNISRLSMRALYVDYVRMIGVSNFISEATLRKKERIEALMAVYAALKMGDVRAETQLALKKAQYDQFNHSVGQ